MPLRRLRTHVDAHRASGCPWQNQPTNFKKQNKKKDVEPLEMQGREYASNGLTKNRR